MQFQAGRVARLKRRVSGRVRLVKRESGRIAGVPLYQVMIGIPGSSTFTAASFAPDLFIICRHHSCSGTVTLVLNFFNSSNALRDI